jgi:hypothetical protein
MSNETAAAQRAITSPYKSVATCANIRNTTSRRQMYRAVNMAPDTSVVSDAPKPQMGRCARPKANRETAPAIHEQSEGADLERLTDTDKSIGYPSDHPWPSEGQCNSSERQMRYRSRHEGTTINILQSPGAP